MPPKLQNQPSTEPNMPGPTPPQPPPVEKKEKEPIAGVDYCIMQCPHCMSTNTVVVPDKKAEESKGAWRRRLCKSCNGSFKEALHAEAAAK